MNLNRNIELKLLYELQNNKNMGTIELANKIGIAPKNLIARLDKLLLGGFIIQKTVPAKPSGRKVISKLIAKGEILLRLLIGLHDLRYENIRICLMRCPVCNKSFSNAKQKRRLILSILKEESMIQKEIQKKMLLSKTAVKHHLNILEREGFITIEKKIHERGRPTIISIKEVK